MLYKIVKIYKIYWKTIRLSIFILISCCFVVCKIDNLRSLLTNFISEEDGRFIFRSLITVISPLFVFYLSNLFSSVKEKRKDRKERFDIRENLVVALQSVVIRIKKQVPKIKTLNSNIEELKHIGPVNFKIHSTFIEKLVDYEVIKIWNIIKCSFIGWYGDKSKGQFYNDFVVLIEHQKELDKSLVVKYKEMIHDIKKLQIRWNDNLKILIEHLNQCGQAFTQDQIDYDLYQAFAFEKIRSDDITAAKSQLEELQENINKLPNNGYNKFNVDSIQYIQVLLVDIKQWDTYHEGYPKVFQSIIERLDKNTQAISELCVILNKKELFY